MKQCPVVHFEMPAKDSKRMANFYASVFGWHTQDMGKEMGDYVLAGTVASDQNGRPTQAGGINGGLYPKTDDSDITSVVISVDDIDEYCEKVKKAGCKLLNEKVKIPGVGWYVSFIDTEGNKVSMLQAEM